MITDLSHALRHRFVKDCDLPIQLLQDPYFEYFLNLIAPYFPSHGGVRERLEAFEQCVRDVGGESAYFSYDARLKNDVIQHVQKKPEYTEFTECRIQDVFPIATCTARGVNLYNPANAGGQFISLDLVSGNFRAMRTFDRWLVDGTDNYADFLGGFTTYSHFQTSKHVRQYIFGNLCPKCQIHMERWFMAQIINALLRLIPEGRFVVVSHDEVILRVEEGIHTLVNLAISDLLDRYNLPGLSLVKKESFTLRRVGDFYVKVFEQGGFELKCVPEYLFAQALKHHLGQKVEPMDLAFYFERRIARFMEPYFETAPLPDEVGA